MSDSAPQVSSAQSPALAPPSDAGAFTIWTWLALATSVGGVLGSLHLSMEMGLKACPLCFYQRTFVMGVAGVLLAGWMMGNLRGPQVSYLAMPLAAGGLTVAIFHVLLEANGTLECPRGIARIGSAPQQSLLMFLILIGFLGMDVGKQVRLWGPAVACLVIGAVLAYGAIRSVPSVIAPDYSKPLDEDGCRKLKT